MQNKPRKGIMDWVDKTRPQVRRDAASARAAYVKKATVDPQGINIRPKVTRAK